MADKPQISVAFPTQVQPPDGVVQALLSALAGLLGGGTTVSPPAPAPVAPGPPAAPLPPGGGLGTAAGIAQRFLEVLGAPVEDMRLAMVAAWIACEKGGNPAQWNNPMNTTLRTDASVGSANSVGVQIYATIDDGIQANVWTLEQANMTAIRNALFAGDEIAFAHSFASAPWGTSAACVGSQLGV